MVIKGTYKDNLLELETNVISHSDITFEITSDKEFTGFLVVTYQNKQQRTVELVKTITDYVYRGRFKTYYQDINNLVGKHTLKLCTNEGLTTISSNKIDIAFDIQAINQLVTIDSNKEIIKLKKELADLKQMLLNIQNNKTIATIKVDNLTDAELGTIPVLVNKAGIYHLKTPFANIIEQVNGVYPEQGVVEVTPDDIRVGNTTLSEFLANTSNALKALKDYNDKLKAEIVILTSKHNDLELELQKHLSNPII